MLSTTVAIPQRCRRRLHRHRHPRRTAAAGAAAAAAVRRLLCCGCGWCLPRLFLNNLIKSWLFCYGGDRGDRARPSCCTATILAGPSPPSPPPPPPPPLLLLRPRLRCCYCGGGGGGGGAAAAAVLLFSLCRTRVPQVFCVRCCRRSMLLCVDSVHITGRHVFYLLLLFFWKFYRKLSQMHVGVNLAFSSLMKEL